MKLPEALHDEMEQQAAIRTSKFPLLQGGFTLLEILLAVSITLVLVLFTLPIGMRFFAMQNEEEVAATLASTLSRAHTFAFYGKGGVAWGVKFLEDRYVLFEGSSYDERDTAFDEVHAIDAGMNVTAPSEILFAQKTGGIGEAQTILVSNGRDDIHISVNEAGLAALE